VHFEAGVTTAPEMLRCDGYLRYGFGRSPVRCVEARPASGMSVPEFNAVPGTFAGPPCF